MSHAHVYVRTYARRLSLSSLKDTSDMAFCEWLWQLLESSMVKRMEGAYSLRPVEGGKVEVDFEVLADINRVPMFIQRSLANLVIGKCFCVCELVWLSVCASLWLRGWACVGVNVCECVYTDICCMCLYLYVCLVSVSVSMTVYASLSLSVSVSLCIHMHI